jgi:hypothetical protein
MERSRNQYLLNPFTYEETGDSITASQHNRNLGVHTLMKDDDTSLKLQKSIIFNISKYTSLFIVLARKKNRHTNLVHTIHSS